MNATAAIRDGTDSEHVIYVTKGRTSCRAVDCQRINGLLAKDFQHAFASH